MCVPLNGMPIILPVSSSWRNRPSWVMVSLAVPVDSSVAVPPCPSSTPNCLSFDCVVYSPASLASCWCCGPGCIAFIIACISASVGLSCARSVSAAASTTSNVERTRMRGFMIGSCLSYHGFSTRASVVTENPHGLETRDTESGRLGQVVRLLHPAPHVVIDLLDRRDRDAMRDAVALGFAAG